MFSRWTYRVLAAILALALASNIVAAAPESAFGRVLLSNGDAAIERARQKLAMAKLAKDKAEQTMAFEEARGILTADAEPVFRDALNQFKARYKELRVKVSGQAPDSRSHDEVAEREYQATKEAMAEIETGLVEARFKLATITYYLSETYVDPKNATRSKLLQAASKEFDSIYQGYRPWQAGVLAHAWQARCEEGLGHMDEARDIYEEVLVNAPDPDRASVDQATMYAQVEMFYLRLSQTADPKRYLSEANEWLNGGGGGGLVQSPSHKPWEKVSFYSGITLDLAGAELALCQKVGDDEKRRWGLHHLRKRLNALIKLDNEFKDDMVRLRREIDQKLGVAESGDESLGAFQPKDENTKRERDALLAQTYLPTGLNVQEQALKESDALPCKPIEGKFLPGGVSVSGGTKRALLGSGGGTKRTERAVAAALAWLARHQNVDGSWSIDYRARCKDQRCTGPGGANAPGAATAFGLLPFLAAGQTHETKGPYRGNIYAGIVWMIAHQKPTGDLSVTEGQTQMYSHGLATIMLCEAYGTSHDKRLEAPARAALHFIETCQDQQTGGWWYTHRQPGGDTSVFGWQFMALRSGMMAGLLPPGSHACFDLAKKWLGSVGQGASKGLFSYRPDQGPTDTMTAVGLLCSQYLGATAGDPRIVGGTRFLMDNLPNAKHGNVYYWYYATQVMHHQPGPEWDKWNRQMRTVLIETQCGDTGCANGSWDPMKGMPQWASMGGRLMMTSLAALTLEVYYRYPPLNGPATRDEQGR
jgi:tetratricopeptide (TPR) repeat protein